MDVSPAGFDPVLDFETTLPIAVERPMAQQRAQWNMSGSRRRQVRNERLVPYPDFMA